MPYYAIGSLFPAICLVRIGSFLYEEKTRFYRNWKWGSVGILIFVMENILRTILQYQCFLMPEASSHLLQWYSGFGILSAMGIFLAAWFVCRHFSSVK